MARTTKKQKELTLEEKLAQALVPVEEQPYPIPENWCWTRIGSVCGFERGITFPASAKEFEPTQDNIPCLRTANIQEILETDDLIYINKSYLKGNINKLSQIGDIIFSSANSRELVGKTSYVSSLPCSMTFGGFVLTVRTNHMSNKYIFYYLRYEYLMGSFMKKASQTTNIANINAKTLANHVVPIPPLDEQNRIVDRIESLFSKLDEAKEKAQSVIDSYEDNKAAILYQALSGKLTKEWRKKHGYSLKEWEMTTVGDCSALITKGASPRWQGISYTDDRTQTLFVTSENVREGFLDWSKEKYLDNKINTIQKRSVLKSGDVLVNIVGASIGRSAIYNRKHLANTNQAVCLVRVKPVLLNEYLCLYFNSPFALTYYNDNKVETARANISLTSISEMPINLPSYVEQLEIVDRLNDLLEREVFIKATAERVVEQIDILKKSILSLAFRGKLGMNMVYEENVIELLNKCLLRS